MADVGEYCHEELVFHSTDESFLLEPREGGPVLAINRLSHEVSVLPSRDAIPYGATRSVVYGVLGTIRLVAGPCLVLVKQRTKVGVIERQPIWRLDEVSIVPYYRSTAGLTPEQKVYNDKYLAMVKHVFNTPDFYFSYTYDLTHSLQRLYYTTEDFRQMSLLERSEQRFVWNQHLLQELSLHPDTGRFCLPLIHGFVRIKQCCINGEWFSWAVVSRRSVYRAGTRMWTRGIDRAGYVANFVETEQIVEYEELRSSFVQTRGSIPLFWKQDPNLKYKPPPTLTEDDHVEAFSLHFEGQVMSYGKIVAINLIDQKGSEGRLQQAFRYHVENSNRQMVVDNVKYEYFDFHHECRAMRWDRLSILMDRLAQDQHSLGFFLMDGQIMKSSQEGVFRTNCIDCLDRTNVVQSMLGRRYLQEALTKAGILTPGQRVEDQPAFETLFKHVWADHADVISTQYSGTGALKTDFTRTGRRTKQGVLRDGLNSAVRYLKNNFTDGDRQDALDLVLGKYHVQSSEGTGGACPLRAGAKDAWLLVLPALVSLSILALLACILLSSEYSAYTLLYIMLCTAVAVAAVAGTFSVGPRLVNAPKLCPTDGVAQRQRLI